MQKGNINTETVLKSCKLNLKVSSTVDSKKSVEENLSAMQHWQSTPVLLPGKSHGQRSLADYSPWGQKESDTTE